MLSRAQRLLRKSIAAMVSSVEIYNKPDYKYREETFAILALNAWELLFKGWVLENNHHDLKALYIYEHRTLADGGRSKREYIRRNRSGNPMTIGLGKAIGLIEGSGWHVFDPAVKANIDGLTEIRDNSVHFSNENLGFSKVVQELGTATVQNYVKLVKLWFDEDLSQYNFYLMPLAFFRSFRHATAVDLSTEERNVVRLLAELHADHHQDEDEEFSVLLEMDVRLKRTAETTAARLAIGDDPDAIPVVLTEEDIRQQYPWDYGDLNQVLRDRYSDFKLNQAYHELRMPLKDNPMYVMQRFLDPGNPNSAKKDFYSPNVLNVFDRHYRRPDS